MIKDKTKENDPIGNSSKFSFWTLIFALHKQSFAHNFLAEKNCQIFSCPQLSPYPTKKIKKKYIRYGAIIPRVGIL